MGRKKVVLLAASLVMILTNIVLAGASPPDASKWHFYPGDGHVHTKHSDYDWEYITNPLKAPPGPKDQYEKAVELNYKWLIITNHEQMINPPEYLAIKTECQELNQTQGGCLIDSGVEMGSIALKLSRGHFLAYNAPFMVFWAKGVTERDRKFAEVIKDIGNMGGLGFVAHPTYFRLPWKEWDLVGKYLPEIKGYIGLEWINSGKIPEEQLKKKTFAHWSQMKDVPIIGNSDAHFSDKIGCSYSYVYFPNNKIRLPALYLSLLKGRTVISNGPFAAISVGGANVGEEVELAQGKEVPVNIFWSSNEGCGQIKEIRIYDKKGIWKNEPVITLNPDSLQGERQEKYTPQEDTFLYLEAETSKGKVAYTNPIFIKVKKKLEKTLSMMLIVDESDSASFHDPYYEKRYKLTESLIDGLKPEDSLGIINFDGDAIVRVPPTKDKREIENTLAVPALYPFTPGTNITKALNLALEYFKEDKTLNHKVAILVTDGIDPLFDDKVLQEYKSLGVKIYTLLLSKPDFQAQPLPSMDFEIKKPNPDLLKKIAKTTGGIYYSSAAQLEKLKADLEKEREKPIIIGEEVPLKKDRVVLKEGETYTQEFEITSSEIKYEVAITWPGSEFSLTLIDPEGKIIDSKTKIFNLVHSKTDTSEYYIIDNPIPGKWKLKVKAVEVPQSGEEVKIATIKVSQTPPQVTLSGLDKQKAVSKTIDIKATAEDTDGIVDFGLYIDGELVKSLGEEQLGQSRGVLEYKLETNHLNEGFHTISALAIDSNYVSGEETTAIIVDNEKPQAQAGLDRTVKEDRRILFDGSESYNYIPPEAHQKSFFWDFGDGETTATFAPVIIHIYKDPGQYTLKLTVKDEVGNSDTDSIKITVLDITPPEIRIMKPREDQEIKGKMEIEADIKDNTQIDKVEIRVNGKLIDTKLKPPYRWHWDTRKNKRGKLEIEVTAQDIAGNRASQKVNVNIVNFPWKLLLNILLVLIAVAVGGLRLYQFYQHRKYKGIKDIKDIEY